MLLNRVLPALGIVTMSVVVLAGQDHLAAVNARGAAVMGFDQALTTHHFHLFADGGAIDVSVKDASDTKNLDAIRSHLPHVAMMFGDGNVEAPMLARVRV